ncbi:protein of unknown function [Mariniphaga anaerophila]|uniref:Carbohydrate-binding domain-containing protein n=1 Tax=Mariniphaga anaerophila TaxID=1484053 RepID=A0A1M4TMF5_9BACT|nr:carbohydrate-binding domain-containing protein [Mariniphaga anaerophila]SHE45651.1 protein of unknown function [Mariniphaga anaerophila]
MKKKSIFAGLFFLFLLSGCTKDSIFTDNEEEDIVPGGSDTSSDEVLDGNQETHESSDDYVWNESDVVNIILSGSSIAVEGAGATVSNSVVTITTGGTYKVTGTLNNGQLIVDSDNDETVRIILSGANIACSNSAAVYVKNAEKTVLILAEDTENELADGAEYVYASGEDEPKATLYSADDLTLYGNGQLSIKGNYNDAVSSKDGLILKDVNLVVEAVDDGIRGKDYLVVKNSTLKLDVEGDGLKSDNEDDTSKGYIHIESGSFEITSGGDAVQAETDLVVANGDFTITSGGGSSYGYNSGVSAKGLKAGNNLIIDYGNFVVSSADDAIHSNEYLTVNDGVFEISTGDDGVHADTEITINKGDFNITKSYEGIESAIIVLNGGNISIVSSDDGLNCAGGNDGSATGRPGFGGFTSSGNYYLYINDGRVAINATGDGIDVNGTIEMSGGTVIVHGPTSNNNGILDYDRAFNMNGGVLIGAGSAGMAQAPGSGSSQNTVALVLSSTNNAGTLVHFQNDGGDELVTFAPAKKYQLVLYSSPDLVKGKSFTAYLGGSHSGNPSNGLYSDGTYTPGSLFSTFSVSDVVTVVR